MYPRLHFIGVLAATFVFGGALLHTAWPQTATTQSPAPKADSTPIPPAQLEALVAPIALYPDPLLAQTLAASTYPLEIIQLQQWLAKNSGLKGDALKGAVEKQSWDPSVQALAALPDVVKRLSDDIQWTTDLGNAFLAQQKDVMDAVQRMRAKAQEKGALESNEQQVVQTKTVEQQQVIVIEQANPQVVYVPAYNPTVVYGAPVYPYPPIYYPPVGAVAISFGVGMAMGAWMGGGWGWGPTWGHSSSIYINNNNTFVRNENIRTHRTVTNNNWQHNGQHRGGAPYRDRATADRYGGTRSGDSLANRQANAKQQLGRQGGSAGMDRSAGSAVGSSGGSRGVDPPGGNTRSTGASAGNTAAGTGNNRSAGGADRVGSYDLSRGSGTPDRGAFGGGDSGFNGSRANAAQSRGASSMRGGGAGGGRSRR